MEVYANYEYHLKQWRPVGQRAGALSSTRRLRAVQEAVMIARRGRGK